MSDYDEAFVAKGNAVLSLQKILAEQGYVAALLDIRARAEAIEGDLSMIVEMFDKAAAEKDFPAASLFVLTEARNGARRVLDWLRLAAILCAALAHIAESGSTPDPDA